MTEELGADPKLGRQAVPTSEEIVARLESELRCRDERIERLEKRIEGAAAKRRDWIDKVQLLVPILQAGAVAFFAFLFTGNVTTAIQKQQLALSGAKEMRDLLLDLEGAQTTKEKAAAAALTLSAFGKSAVTPLINVLQAGGQYQTPAAERGLFAVGLTDSAAVCTQLLRVIEDRRQLYGPETHLGAIQVLGELRSREAVPALREYTQLLGTGKPSDFVPVLERLVRHDQELGPEAVTDFRTAVGTALREIESTGATSSR